MLGAEEVVQFSTEPAVLADGLRLANHFHALSLGLTRASVAAGAAWLLTSIAHEVQNSSELNPDGMNRVRVAKWLLAIVEVQLEAIERMGLPGRHDRGTDRHEGDLRLGGDRRGRGERRCCLTSTRSPSDGTWSACGMPHRHGSGQAATDAFDVEPDDHLFRVPVPSLPGCAGPWPLCWSSTSARPSPRARSHAPGRPGPSLPPAAPASADSLLWKPHTITPPMGTPECRSRATAAASGALAD